jgi:uncharacterized membrane protein YraQ (UPF0718 family)
LALATYGVTAAVDAETAGEVLLFFTKVMRRVLPALVIVFILLLAAELLFEPEWIKRNLGREAGIKGWLLAAVGGVLAAGPIYAWYALLRELREKGMHASLAAAFLYSRAGQTTAASTHYSLLWYCLHFSALSVFARIFRR